MAEKSISTARPMVLALKDVKISRYEMSLKQKIINTLADPNIAYLFMMAGLLGLYMEFSHPGVIFPGVAGAICLLLALASFQLLPLNYAGLALIALGIALLVGEAFLPSFGVLGVGGIIALAIGSLLLFDTESSDLVVDRSIVFTAVGTVGAIMLALSYLVFKSQKLTPTTGMDGLIGEIGEVRGKLESGGQDLCPRRVLERGGRFGNRRRCEGRSHRLSRHAAQSAAFFQKLSARKLGGSNVWTRRTVYISDYCRSRAHQRHQDSQRVRARRRLPARPHGRRARPGHDLCHPGHRKNGASMDLRTVTMDIPPQDVITRDNVSVKVNAVLYFG